MELSTEDKIIEAAVELVYEKGYKGATTREIAERAGVNEVTLFRHFGNKKGIVEAAMQKYAFVELLENTFAEKIVWDLEKDLNMIVREYQALLDKKKNVILLALRESEQFAELNNLLKQVPQKYIEIITNYFTQMVEKEKIRKVDPYIVATNFVFINFGYFLTKTRINSGSEELSVDDFINKNIAYFIQMLQ
ncbi:TetR/AcrR family transcriptional regulator [Oceanobacillus locisalsi]|uniref:TetR/AcrR family transcriptional regulator n=1 Tax=Oceanobacillus locisalsi TaxID=546107 RepID=A0ABW3NI45_9BACI